jgi:phasin family protein
MTTTRRPDAISKENAKPPYDAGLDNMRHAAEATQDAARSALANASENARHFSDLMTQALGLPAEKGQELARQSSENFDAIMETGKVLARGFEDISREWVHLTQERSQKNLDRLNSLSRSQSAQDFVAAQSDLVRENLQQLAENGRRIAEISTCISNEAAQSITAQPKSNPRRAA